MGPRILPAAAPPQKALVPQECYLPLAMLHFDGEFLSNTPHPEIRR